MFNVWCMICWQCNCHCFDKPSNSQSGDRSRTVIVNNLVDNDSGEIKDILNGMNLNKKLLKSIKEFGSERVVASMDPSILQSENGDHVFSLPTIPKFVDAITSWFVRFVPVIPVLQEIDCRVEKCQVIIMSSSYHLIRQMHPTIIRVGKYMARDVMVKPSLLFAIITKKYIKQQLKSNSIVPRIMMGTFDNILSLITKVDIDLRYIKTLVVIEPNDPPTKRTSFDHEVLKYLPRNARILTSADYLKESIRKKFQKPAQEIIRVNLPPVPAVTPAPKIKKSKKKSKKNKKKTNTSLIRVESSNQNPPQNAQNDEKDRKRKISRIHEDIVVAGTSTNNAQNVELQNCKKIKLEEEIFQIDTTDSSDAESVDSLDCKEFKLKTEEETIRYDTSDTESVESESSEIIKEEHID